jgi:hypothetical protein
MGILVAILSLVKVLRLKMTNGNQHGNPKIGFSAMLSGGLGNQIISFANVWSFAAEQDLPLSVDKSYYDQLNFLRLTATGHDYQEFYLDQFRLPRNSDGAEIAFENMGINWTMSHLKTPRIFGQRVIPSLFNNFYIHKNLKEFKPPSRHFRIYGNFLELNAIDLMQDLGGSIDLLNQESRNVLDQNYFSDAIHLHVRTGDLIAVMPQLELPIAYYNRSIDLLRNGTKNPTVVVYSDNEILARDFLSHLNLDVTLSSPRENGITGTAQQFMSFMKAQNKIVSNSSFSLAAARLGDNTSRTCFPFMMEKIYGRVRTLPGWVEIDA